MFVYIVIEGFDNLLNHALQ